MDPSEWEQVGSIQDAEHNGVMVSNLPLLFANSEPTSLRIMTQVREEEGALWGSHGQGLAGSWALVNL